MSASPTPQDCSVMDREGNYLLDMYSGNTEKEGHCYIKLVRYNWYSLIKEDRSNALFFLLRDVILSAGRVVIEASVTYYRDGHTAEDEFFGPELFPLLKELNCEPSLLECMLIGTDKLKGG